MPFTKILLVEDSPEDYESTVRAFTAAGLKNSIEWCEDGDQALDYLHRRGEYAGEEKAERPCLILLDLNLPGTGGREVLAEIKQDPGLRMIPVVVLTTSADDRDIQDCYKHGVKTYIQKPVDFEGFVAAIGRLKEYWLEIAVLPQAHAG